MYISRTNLSAKFVLMNDTKSSLFIHVYQKPYMYMHTYIYIYMVFRCKADFLRKLSDLTLILGRGLLSTQHPVME